MKKVITYGTFDLLHVGHINLLRRAKALGDYLIVVVSSDEFNAGKGKKAYHSFEDRNYCEFVYLPRTEGISTTKIKNDLNMKD